jgi:hypothetical protein
MANHRERKVPGDRNGAAAYLASRLEELMPLAQRNGLPVVAYLLDMALMEAKAAVGQAAKPRDRLR